MLTYVQSWSRHHAIHNLDGTGEAVPGDAMGPRAVRDVVRAVEAGPGQRLVVLDREIVLARHRGVPGAHAVSTAWVVAVIWG